VHKTDDIRPVFVILNPFSESFHFQITVQGSGFDDFVKSRKTLFFVIPAKAGIQSFQMVTDGLDSGYRIESGTSFTGVTTFYEFIRGSELNFLNNIPSTLNGEL